MQKMDNPKVKDLLLKLGGTAARSKVKPEHFPHRFDLSPSVTAPVLASEKKTDAVREGQEVTAIHLNLNLDAFIHQKWGRIQGAKHGNWRVERDGQVHIVAEKSFEQTYKKIGPATYTKNGSTWAAPAAEAGIIVTQEGETHFRHGDYIVWNDAAGSDGYAVTEAQPSCQPWRWSCAGTGGRGGSKRP